MENTPTFDELRNTEIGYAAYADNCIYVCPAAASEYENSIYRIDKDSHEVTSMFFTDYIDSSDYDPEKIVKSSEIWDYLQ